MRFRFSRQLTIASLLLAAACGGGGAAAGAVNIGTACDTSAGTVCLDGCSLGCRGLTCEISDIAQNENVVLRFSSALNPLSVNTSTIQFRTATGEEPVGDFLVNGSVVEFVPRVLVVGSQSFFGFQSGETYTMTIPGGAGQAQTVLSTSGRPLGATFRCTLRVTRGIIDHNGVPPSARLLQPTTEVDVPQNTIVVLEFNELIDATPFASASPSTGPVLFSVARTAVVGNQRVCNGEASPLSGAVRLELLPEVPSSIVTFTPTVPLPATSCIRISTTDQVKDLAGRPADPQVFEFLTIEAPTVEDNVIEEFDTDDQLDLDRSAGSWTGGFASFAQIGGDGRHGSFNLETMATNLGSIGGFQVFQMNTSNTVIPAASTISGSPITVNDGRYFFSDMVVPANVRLVFTGSAPPVFTVRGRLQIDGIVDVSGQSVAHFDTFPSTGAAPGQTGGPAGAFGGRGGDGGDRCFGQGVVTADMSGENGADCRVQAGHAFAAQLVGTGGRGASLFPVDGRNTSVITTTAPLAFVLMSAAGGAGGGLVQAGGQGRAVSNTGLNTAGDTRTDLLGPPAAAGISLPALLPVPGGSKSSLHFLIGGSGGGGGGSCPALMRAALLTSPTNGVWAPGSAGGGGGGAIGLRAGDELRVSAGASVLAAGGRAGISVTTQNTALAVSAPGGGGSGGAIVLQSGNAAQILGTVDVRGGEGGVLDRPTLSLSVPPDGGRIRTEGGAGSRGVLRLELPGSPTPQLLPNALPVADATNVGPLAESDTRVGFQSLFYSSRQPNAPEYTRYEIHAVIDGVPIVFSDDPAFGVPARAGFGPLEVFWQGVRMDIATGAIDNQDLLTRQWRQRVGGITDSLASDSRNAFRFLLILDRTNGQDVQIDSIKVFFNI